MDPVWKIASQAGGVKLITGKGLRHGGSRLETLVKNSPNIPWLLGLGVAISIYVAIMTGLIYI